MNLKLPKTWKHRRDRSDDERKGREPTGGTNHWFVAGMAKAG